MPSLTQNYKTQGKGVKVLITDQKHQLSKLQSLALLAIAISVVTIAVILLIQKNLPPELPLFFGLPEGEDQLITNQGLVVPSATSLLIIIINLTLAKLIKDDFLKQILVVAGFAVVVFSLATTLKIVLLVGSF